MKHTLAITISIQLVLLTGVWTFAVPKTMVVDLHGGQGAVYTSEVFYVPVHISEATLDISVLMDTYLRISCEIKAGENYVRFHLSNMSISYHFQYDILEFVGILSSRDVSFTAVVDTDGIIQGVPKISMTYYGLW